jgi:cytoskeletal protein CcmA (bactofilin family)
MPTDKSQQWARVQGSTPSASTIGEELMIAGNVTSKGEIHVDGQVQGGIHCHSLVLGENSQFEGSVVAEDVVIRGRLIGSVRALRVALHSKCHVEGDLYHHSLTIEQGAYFKGKSRRFEESVSSSQAEPIGRATARSRLVRPRQSMPSERIERSGGQPENSRA